MEHLVVTPTNQQSVIDRAAAVLAAGGLVIFPTETTYGAGADATNPAAVAKLLKYKARREGKPLSIAVTDIAMAEEYVELSDSARRLYQRFLPGPVTVVSHSRGIVAPGVASEFGTIGVRIPDYPLVTAIVAALGHPMTATSANMSDARRPYSITDVLEPLSDGQRQLIDLVIDAGQLPPNPPSTVIDTTLSTPITLRQGDVVNDNQPANQLQLTSNSPADTKALAGRLLLKHWNDIKTTGLVIGLDGVLGTGKTIFAKGAAEFLQISDEVTSPTYNYIEEYNYTRHGVQGHLYHLDLWKVDSAAQLERLEVNKLWGPNQVVVIEWWQQVAEWLEPQLTQAKIPLLKLTFSQLNELQRQVTLVEPS